MTDVGFEDLLKLVDESNVLQVPEIWTQGRTLYGGLTAALISYAISKHVPDGRELRALNVAFSAPCFANVDFTIETELLREGKSVSQWQGRLVQNGGVCVQVQAVFGVELAGGALVERFEAPDIPGVKDAMFYPSSEAPGFTRNFEIGQSQGDMPVSGGKSLELGGWMRFKQAPKVMSIYHLIALVDAWPPATMMHVTSMRGASTVNWSLQFPQTAKPVNPESFLGYQTSIEQAQAGFGISHAKVWSEDNELLVLSQQLVIVFGE